MTKFISEVARDNLGNVIGVKYEEELFNPVMGSLGRNNTFVPNIDHIVYTLKTEDSKAKRDKEGNLIIDKKTNRPVREMKKLEKPVLTTVVYFVDGTKATVVNSDLDTVTLTKDGLDASEESKEVGLLYAIGKRIFGSVDDNGKVDGNGFGRKLRDIVKKSTVVNAKKAVKEGVAGKNDTKAPPKKIKKSVAKK